MILIKIMKKKAWNSCVAVIETFFSTNLWF